MDIIEKAQQLKELAKGIDNLPPAAAELLACAAQLAETLAEELTTVKTELAAVAEQVDDVEDAMDELCEDVYGEDDEDMAFEVECPNCSELIQIDEGILEEGGITCPGCNEALEFDISCDCEDGGCEGCKGHE